MASISTIAPALGSPYGGQSITIDGTAFGAAQGTVTIEGRSCIVTSWSDTHIVAVTPKRVSSGGIWMWGGGIVALVVTTAATATASGSYEYLGTIFERALAAVRAGIAGRTVQTGAYFDWSPSQVLPIKLDQLSGDNGAPYPQAVVYVMDGQQDREHSPHGFLIIKHNCIAQGVMPLSDMDDWDYQLDHILSDLYSGIMIDSAEAGTVISCNLSSFDKGRIDTASAGSLGVASITFELEIQTAYNDFNKNHGFTVT